MVRVTFARRVLLTLALVAPAVVPQAVTAQEVGQPLGEAVSSSVNPAEALNDARQVLADAFESGQTPHPDQQAWRAAFDASEAAIDAARASGTQADLRTALLLSARTYALTGWHSRAFARFDEYFTEGGELAEGDGLPGQPSDLELFVRAADQLAYARYLAGDHTGATGYYLTVLEIAPRDTEALRWLARIAFERGDVDGARVAVGLWERLLEVDPEDATARYYLARSQQRAQYGVAASDAFHSALSAYDAGDSEGALSLFQSALTANPEFTEAEEWAGRVALELGLPQLAAQHWGRVVEARPDDLGAAYFLEVASAQVEHGVAAGRHFYDGMAAYSAGDLEAATESFIAATEAAPAYVDAWVWAARSLQETSRAAESVPYWETVLELTPDDERAAWFLRRAQLAIELGDIAGPAFFDGLAAYEAGDAATATALLERAVEARPEFVEAWGYLGRIAFQQGRYEDAALAYGRASDLAPGVDEYAFFAEEAARLAGGDEVAEQEPSVDEVAEEEPPVDEAEVETPDAEDADEGADEDDEEPAQDGGVQPLPPDPGG